MKIRVLAAVLFLVAGGLVVFGYDARLAFLNNLTIYHSPDYPHNEFAYGASIMDDSMYMWKFPHTIVDPNSFSDNLNIPISIQLGMITSLGQYRTTYTSGSDALPVPNARASITAHNLATNIRFRGAFQVAPALKIAAITFPQNADCAPASSLEHIRYELPAKF